MREKRRFVFDTNVVVSAAIFRRSVPALALEKARRIGILLMSDSTARELDGVLRREKFDRYVDRATRDEFIAATVREAMIVLIDQAVTDCRDSKDNKFLELAVCGSAERLVTGDEDLLALNPFRGIPIVTPQEFLADSGL